MSNLSTLKIGDITYKVGELYRFRGRLVVIKKLHEPETSVPLPSPWSLSHLIGKAETINGKELSIYSSTILHKASDKDIKEYIIDRMTSFKVDESLTVSLSNNGVLLMGEEMAIGLNKKQLKELVKLIKKETNLE